MRRGFIAGAAFLTILASCTNTNTSTTPQWTSNRVDDGSSVTPVAVRVADMDGDGKPDIVTAWRGAAATSTTAAVQAAIQIHFQQTPQTWVTATIDSGSRYSQVNAIAIADVDADGHPDIVVAAMDRIIYLHAPANASSAGAWVAYDLTTSIGTGLTAWFDVAVGQIDGANGLDIVAVLGTATGGRVSWFRSPANPNSASGWDLFDIDNTTRSSADSVLVKDLSGDGRLDVISSAPGETVDVVSWYEQPTDPTTTWTKHAMSNYPGATRMALGDMNADSLPDLAVISPKTGSMSAAWLPQPTPPTSRWPGWLIDDFSTGTDKRTPTDVGIADINGDGQQDVVVASDSPAEIAWFTPGSNNTQFWRQTLIATTTGTPTLIDLADIDQDGHVDVVAPINSSTAGQDQVVWFKNPTQ